MRLIAHRIHKNQHLVETRLSLRDTLLPSHDDLSQGLMDQVRGAIMQRNPVAGRFKRLADAEPEFEQRLKVYLRSGTEAEFIAFTHDALRLLERRMQAEPLATGAYVVFIEYTQQETAFLVVVLLSPRAQPSFDEDLNLIKSITLDFDHLRHAGRIRMADVPANAGGVVHFVSRRSDGTSDYFRDFLGVEAVTDSTAQANLLFTAVRTLVRSGQLADGVAEQAMERTHAYWDDCRRNKRAMTLTALSHLIAPDQAELVLGHLAREDYGLAGEFQPPAPRDMRKFVKFTFRDRGLRIEFDRNDWLDKISVRGRSVTIRDVPEDLIQKLGEAKE